MASRIKYIVAGGLLTGIGLYYYIFGRGLSNTSRFEEWQIKHGYKKLPE